MDMFSQAYFAFCVGLDHHADDNGKDHLISGLNTTGSLIPITFTANMLQTFHWLVGQAQDHVPWTFQTHHFLQSHQHIDGLQGQNHLLGQLIL